MATHMIRLTNNGVDLALQRAREIWPYRVAYRTKLRMDSAARDWCVQQFGLCGSRVDRPPSHVSGQSTATVTLDDSRSWSETGMEFLFRDADQAFEFKMRWHGVTE